MIGPLGTRVRLSVRARDVMLSRSRPEGLSALNILPAKVTEVHPDGVSTTVALSLVGTPLLARVTSRSVQVLGLSPGTDCFAILKSVALIRA
jgi:molybdate transport system ATP-binding protein